MFRTLRRLVTLGSASALIVVVLVAGATTVKASAALPAMRAAADSPPLQLTKSGPSSTTPGSTVSYTLTATNPTDGVNQYDVSFRDQLPPGVTYVSGSTQPADLGDPTIVTQPDGSQVLVWENVFDLPPGGSRSLTFSVTFDAQTYPVDSELADSAVAYGSSNPLVSPQFDADGNLVPDPNVTASNEASASTTVTALQVTKDEPSPEGKLLRGVHDDTTVYTLTVSAGNSANTDDVVVNDYLPAALEYLECGGVDNSTTGVEYPGAPSLSVTPPVGPDCLIPTAVDTVSSPPGLPSGVYTQVTWDLGTLRAGRTITIKYAAGVPLRSNTLVFPGGKPSPNSLDQAANLDNNLGPSTRQNGAAASLTNHVDVTGDYTGDVAEGGSAAVDATADHTVSINDVRILKSVSPTTFESGQIDSYSLEVDSGEYVDASDVVVTDTIPNGICPLGASNFVTGSPADCAPTGDLPSVPYQSVTQNSDGTFTVVFQPIAVAHDGTTTITFPARMRTTFTGGPLAGEPTAEGDTFTNNVTLSATTTPIPNTGESGDATVTDHSSVSQTSVQLAFTKEIQPRATPQNCSANTYAPSDSLSPSQMTFRTGDQICFELTVTFPPFNATVNPTVDDFLPSNLDYVAGSATLGPENTLPADQVSLSTASGAPVWTLGASEPNGTRTVAPTLVFQVRLAATVNTPAPGGSSASYQNISKLVVQNSTGSADSFRSNAGFNVDPAPAVSILKGVDSVNGQPAGGNPPNVDHVQVAEGDQVVFRVDVTNPATSDVSVHTLQVWDVLASGIHCAQVSAISDSGVCTDPGSPGQPPFATATTNSAIVWDQPPTAVLDAGDSVTLLYTVTIPTGVSVDDDLVDTAYVRSFDADTNVPGTVTYFPTDNVDTTVPTSEQDAPAASDPSDVFLGTVGVTKLVSSAINEPGNKGGEPPPGVKSTQATIGEQVTYTISSTLPADATVYDGVLTDPLPAGLEFVSASASDLPPGATLDTSTGTVTLPSTFDNTSSTPLTFSVVIIAQVTTASQNTAGVTWTNTATFTSNRSPGGAPTTPESDSSDVEIVEPSPTLSKSANPTDVVGGQTVNYTLTAGNAASASEMHDAWAVDCLPAGLAFDAYQTPSQGSTVAPVPGAGAPCPSGTTQLAWNVGDVDPGVSPALMYTATVTPQATGLETFTNDATLTGDSLAGTRSGPTDPGNPDGRLYTATANQTVTVLGATITKSANPTIDTVGQTVTYTVVGVLNQNVSYFNLSVIDRLPPGLDPNSLQLVSQDCVNQDGTTCGLTPGTPLTSAPDGSDTDVGLLFGNAAGEGQDRIITIVYTLRVANVAAAKSGASLTDSVHLAWDNTAQSPPSSAAATFDQTSPDASAPITVVEPSVSIAKVVDDSTVEPGQRFTYTLRVSNADTPTTSAAYDVKVSDTIPAGVVVDSNSISDGGTLRGTDGNGAGGSISWTLPGPIAPGAVTSLTYSATLGPSSTLTSAQQVNAAQVTGYESLPSGGRSYPATSVATAPVTPEFPDVEASKATPLGNEAYIGQPFTWQITLQNTGAATADEISASDILPPSWFYDQGSAEVSVAGGQARQIDPTIKPAQHQLDWTGLGPLAPDVSLTITYTATPSQAVVLDPGVGLSVNQTNTVLPGAEDATGATGNAVGPYGGPTASATAHIAASDVALTKSATVQPIAGGRAGQFTITVSNNGPDPAEGVKVTDGFNDPAPAGVSNITTSGTGWSCSGTPIVCVRSNPSEPPLAAGASYPPITVSYQVASDVVPGTVVTNSATASSTTFDTDTGNNTDQASTTVSTEADLAIAKRLTSPAVVAGQPATYAVAVSNLGPSDSAGPFSVTDTLPEGTTFVSAGGTGWECEPVAPGTVGATLVCTHPESLTVGEVTSDLVVTVGIPASQSADVINTVHISSTTTPDPNPANDTASVDDPVQIRADLQIQKQHIGAFVGGSQGQYLFTVVNHGPSDAADATISDTLPTGLTYVSSTGLGWTCSASGQELSCNHPTPLTAGSITAVTVTVQIASTVSGPILNTATVSSTTPDPDPSNNTDSDNTSVNLRADLAITKSHVGNAVAGQPLDYTLRVTNNGPSDIPGTSEVTVTDPLPTGLTYESATGPGWTCTFASATSLVTCTAPGPLSAGTSEPDITLTVGVDPDVGPATITNTADVQSDIDDPDLSNNSTEDPTQVAVQADIGIEKTIVNPTPPTPAFAGDQATFSLQATNTGPSDAANVIMTDPLPQYLDYISAGGPGWTCVAPGQIVICLRPSVAAVPPGATTPPITLVAEVDPAIPFDPPGATDILRNVASIDMSSDGTIGPPSEADLPVVAEANLTLTKQPSTSTPVAGTSFIWTMTTHDNGPSDAAAPLTLTDTLPPDETYLSAVPPWKCTAGPPPTSASGQQNVTCTLDAGLAVGADAPALKMLVGLSADAPSGSETNTAQVSSPTPGSPGDAQASVTVTREDNLAITKTHSGDGHVGQSVEFHIVVRNTGPSTADQLVVSDPLPSGLTYISATGQDWSCSASGSDVTCTLAGTLAVGETAPTITVTARTEASAYASVTNTATVFSTDPDLPSRASASDDLAVDPDDNLTLTKRHEGNLTVGQRGTYLLTVANPGPTATPGPVTITDPLPAGLTYVSASGPGWNCSASGQMVTCVRPGAFAVGATSSITLTVLVGLAAVPSVQNTATAVAPGTAPLSASDTAPVPSPPPTPSTSSGTVGLSFTGFDALFLLLGGLALLCVGVFLLNITRRRRSNQSTHDPMA
jgi:large repetitive protein